MKTLNANLRNKEAIMLAVMTTLAIGLSVETQASKGILQGKEMVKSDYAKTKYPIVMVHGWLGWSRIGDDSFNLDYWYQILLDLARICRATLPCQYQRVPW